MQPSSPRLDRPNLIQYVAIYCIANGTVQLGGRTGPKASEASYSVLSGIRRSLGIKHTALDFEEIEMSE